MFLGTSCEALTLISDTATFTFVGWQVEGRGIKLLWAGTPCHHLSRARRGAPGSSMPQALRSNQYHRGRPGLCGKDLDKARVSNLLADRTASLFRTTCRMGVQGGEELPAASFLWMLSGRPHMLQQKAAQPCAVDYCACGTPWRARTRLMLWNGVTGRAQFTSLHRPRGLQL